VNKIHSVFIAEDNIADRDALMVHIARHGGLRVDGSAANGAEALAALRTTRYDLVFLDIDMPILSGFDVIKACGAKFAAYVIITSSFPGFAVEAFDYMALDFLLKPYSKSRFCKAVDRYLARRETAAIAQGCAAAPLDPDGFCDECVLMIQGKGYLWRIPHIDILYLSSHGRRTDIHCRDGDKVANLGLTEVLALLPETGFCRIHRQYAVNRRYIAGLRSDFTGQQSLCLLDADETELPVGRMYQDTLRTSLG
jgi:DNA-binding LytR/AlgR family response regulator